MISDSLVSLIVCIYNGEKYLERCLESIRNQSYKNLEVIMIDDGSTDSSLDIALKFEKMDERFKAIHQENRGVSASRNMGIKISKGEYFGIIDQDDYLNNEYVEYFMNLIIKNGVEIATSDKVMKFSGEKPKDITISNYDCNIESGDATAKLMLLYKIEIGPWNKLISKKLVEENNIVFNDNFFYGEGFAFSVECFQASLKVAVGHLPVYNYRIDNSTSGTSTFSVSKINSAIQAQTYIREILHDKSKRANKVLNFSRWKTISDLYTLLVLSHSEKTYPEEYKKLRKELRKNAKSALLVPVKFKQKIRAISFMIIPDFTMWYIKKKMKKNTNNKFER